MKYIDIHTHPFTEYYSDPKQTVQSWFDENMKLMFIVGCDQASSQEVIDLVKEFKNTYGIIGIHPTLATGKNDGKIIEDMLTDKVIGIGEIGLDYHYDNSPSKEIQFESLKAQIEVARKHNLVVMLHIRDAVDDAIDFISNPIYSDIKFVFHSYSGNKEQTQRLLKLDNVWFSISGVVTFKNAKSLQEAVEIIPVDRIFTETDTPYLAPTPMRGKENKSPYVEYTARFLAHMKNLTEQDFLNQVEANVKKVFGVDAN